MNKLFSVLCFLLFNSIAVHAQYFYKDIISNKQLAAEMQLYKEKKIHSIKLKSFESDGEVSEGFFCERKISRDFKKSELFTKAEVSATSLFTSIFDDKGNIVKSTDSSQISVTYNFYTYDNSGRVTKIFSSIKSSDDDFTNEISQEHIYEYNEDAAVPVSMMLVKNRRDSTKILFMPDENNNVSLEKNTKDGSKYYYYYDAKKQLTDVVHANEYREKLVAVYLFEYNSAGQISQMTTTEEGRNDFNVWKYRYDEGLRAEDRLFSKERKLIGRMEYQY